MADVWYKTGTFLVPASGTTVISTTDKGTNPFAIHVWWTHADVNDTEELSATMGHGFGDGTDAISMCVTAQHAFSENHRNGIGAVGGADNIINMVDPNDATGTKLVVGTTAAMNTNDVTISYTLFSANRIVHYEIWGGLDGSANITTRNDNSATDSPHSHGLGSVPDLALILTNGQAHPASSQHSFLSFGAVTSGINQWALMSYWGDNNETHSGSGLASGFCAGQYNLEYTNWTNVCTAMSSTTFTFTGGTGGDDVLTLWLDLGGIGVAVGDFLKSTTAAPTTQTLPSFGFTPMGYHLATAVRDLETINVQGPGAIFHGAYDGDTGHACGTTNDDGGTADRAAWSRTGEVLFGSDNLDISGVQFSGTPQAITDATVDIEWNPNTTGATDDEVIGYYAFEDTNLGPTINEVTKTESLVVADPSTPLRLRDREQADSITATDADEQLRLRDRGQADALALDYSHDTIRKRTVTILNNVIETQIIDSIIAVKSIAPNAVLITDTVEVTDDSIELRLRFREQLDSAEVADALERSALSPRTLSDSLEVTDALESLRLRERLQSNDFAVVDALESLRLRNRLQTDSLEAVDASEAIRTGTQNRILSDSAEVTDDSIELRLRDREQADSLEAVDADEQLRERNRLQTDSAEVTDADDFFKLADRSLSDSIALTDLAAIPEIGTVLIDSLETVDDHIELRQRIRVLLDSIPVADNIITLVAGNKFVTLSDDVPVTDTHFELRQRISELLDAIEITDAAIADRHGFSYVTTSDDAPVTDNHIELRQRIRQLLDTAEVTDNVIFGKSGIQFRTLGDSIVVADPHDELRERERVQTDALATDYSHDTIRKRTVTILNNVVTNSITDAITAITVKGRSAADTLEMIDAAIELRHRFRVLLDSFAVNDTALAGQTGIEIRVLLDSFAVTDNAIAQRISAAFRTLLSTIEVVDSIITLRERNRMLPDAITVTDNEDWFKLADRLRADSIEVNDAEDWFKLADRTMFDSIALTDLALIPEIGTILFDSLDMGDDSIELRQRFRVLADSLVAVDNVIAERITTAILTVLTDSLEVNDFRFMLRDRNRLAADSLVTTDSEDWFKLADRTMFDSITLTDLAAIPGIGTILFDSLVVTDNSIELRLRPRVTSDILEIADNHIELRQRFRGQSDAIPVTDTDLSAAHRPRSLSDSLEVTDALEGLTIRARVLFDDVDIVDFSFPTYFAEGILVISITKTDTIEVTDNIEANYIFHMADFAVTHGISVLDIDHKVDI